MITCTIIGLAQEMDFATNVVANFVLIRLPTSQVIRAPISEEVTALIATLHGEQPVMAAASEPLPPAAEPAPEPFEPPVDDTPPDPGENVLVFGGNDEVALAATEPPPPPEPEPAPAPPTQATTSRPPGRLRRAPVISRKLEADAKGYPIVPGTADPLVFAPRDHEDDGTRSV